MLPDLQWNKYKTEVLVSTINGPKIYEIRGSLVYHVCCQTGDTVCTRQSDRRSFSNSMVYFFILNINRTLTTWRFPSSACNLHYKTINSSLSDPSQTWLINVSKVFVFLCFHFFVSNKSPFLNISLHNDI